MTYGNTAHADAISLNVAWHMGEGSPFRAALDTGYYDGEDTGLYRSVTEGTAASAEAQGCIERLGLDAEILIADNGSRTSPAKTGRG